ncbi:DUF1223 domain-containing protein [Limibacter armeniacum]|uniref:DUF1223 domain-containing protein n=1 Tax=Limibacter armeniacum TaxID=466084 RepID=UPI002FE6ABFD
MKTYLVLFLILSTFVMSAFMHQTSTPKKDSNTFVVVELFTSEGCSSCPAADKLLSKLVKQAENSGEQIYPLAFHVDYWNYLGWKDPFSQKEFSVRQRKYAKALQSKVYTPQMVFNGKAETVGSNTSKVKTKMEEAAKRITSYTIEVDPVLDKSESEITVAFKVSGDTEGKVINLALVEKMLKVEVSRGENGGKTLEHDNVVRAFKTLPLSDGDEHKETLALPSGISLENASVVAYIQDMESLEILAAVQEVL